MLRTEVRELITLAERLLAVGERATLATLFNVTGSSYRPLGSMMVSGYGSAYRAGGISGGCLEEYVAQQGRRLTEHAPAAMLHFSTADDAEEGIPKPGCGGLLDVLVERMAPAHLDFLQQYQAALEADTASTALCTVESSAADAISVTRSPWSCDPVDALRGEALAHECSVHAVASVTRQCLVHYVPPLTRLVILGAGDDAPPLCRLAHDLGWHVTVADRRARLAQRSRFPKADEVIADNWQALLKRIKLTPRTAVVMMTHSVSDDIELLRLLQNKAAAYVGILGPAQRRRGLLDEVSAIAPLDPAFVARLRGPIGLDLGERNAPAIAVAVIAEILAVLNERPSTPLSRRQDAPQVDLAQGRVTSYA
jgi:xanthine dehydrogenase accessory factor